MHHTDLAAPFLWVGLSPSQPLSLALADLPKHGDPRQLAQAPGPLLKWLQKPLLLAQIIVPIPPLGVIQGLMQGNIIPLLGHRGLIFSSQ